MSEHEKFEEQFSSYFDGELEGDDKAQIEAHLAECAECRAAYASFKETVEAISGIGKAAAPEGFEHVVEKTIKRRSAGRFFSERKFTDRLPLTIIALTAIAIGVVLYLLLRSSETGSLRGSEPKDEAPVNQDVIPQP